jgi:histidinol-phosphate aminotransferase
LDGVKGMIPKKQINDLPVYQPGKPIEEVKKEFNLTEVIKLASNENPFGSSPRATEAAIHACSNLAIYPDGAGSELRQTIANFYGLTVEQVILGNGSDEVVQMINRTYLSEGTNTITADPTFPMYKINADIEGADVIEVPLKDGVHDLQEMKNRIDENTRVVWVCNPNNPSGTYNTQEEVVSFLEGVPSHVLVVLDEAYYEYATAADYPDSIPLLEKYSNIIILRTFSKIYGLAALRIGYGIASPSIIDLINRVREPFNANRVAQAAGIGALSDQEYVVNCREKNRVGLEQFYQAFDQMNLDYYPSQGNFILVNTGRPGNEVFGELLKQGLIVRSGQALGFPTYVRITVGTEEQNKKIISALQEIAISVRS